MLHTCYGLVGDTTWKSPTIGDAGAFPAAASRTWNSLPPEVKSSTTLSTFKSKLKTFLFSLSFPDV